MIVAWYLLKNMYSKYGYGQSKTAVLLLLIAALIVVGCSTVPQSSPPDKAPASSGSPNFRTLSTPPQFVDAAQASGIRYEWKIGGTRPYTILQTIGNGCAFLDYNNDNNLDILLVGPQLALYQGDGHGHFSDVSRAVGLDNVKGYFLGCAVGDYDNDGYEDIYLSAFHGGALLHNEGGKYFRDVTAASGIKPQPWGTSCAFVDVDNDGKLDLYIANYVKFGPNVQPQFCDFMGRQGGCGPGFYQPQIGQLYHNEGGGRFHDITQSWGADKCMGRALGVACADFNGSGRQSIAIANDEFPGDLLENMGARFENVGVASGTALSAESQPHAGMGIDWGDYDNDGKLDLAVGAFQHEPDAIYHNSGQGLFNEQSAALGVANLTSPFLTFGLKWVDYDNDGWLDLVIANGHVNDIIAEAEQGTTFEQHSQLFHNEHGLSFSEVDENAGEPFQRKILGRGLAVGDYDNDGRMDVLIVNSEGAPLLLHNQTAGTGHWLSVLLVGTRSNRDGVGAVVTVEVGGLKETGRCGTDGSYLSASDRRIHFGLGNSLTASTIRVAWPHGGTTTLHNVMGDRLITIREP